MGPRTKPPKNGLWAWKSFQRVGTHGPERARPPGGSSVSHPPPRGSALGLALLQTRGLALLTAAQEACARHLPPQHTLCLLREHSCRVSARLLTFAWAPAMPGYGGWQCWHSYPGGWCCRELCPPPRSRGPPPGLGSSVALLLDTHSLWLAHASHQCLWSRGHLPYVRLCGTPVIGLGPILIQHDLLLANYACNNPIAK